MCRHRHFGGVILTATEFQDARYRSVPYSPAAYPPFTEKPTPAGTIHAPLRT